MPDEIQTETVETTETPTETEQTETVETTETETVETQEQPEAEKEQPETEVEETTETEEQEETTETVEEQEVPEDESSEDEPDADESDKELGTLKGKLKQEQKKVESLKSQNKEYETVVSAIVEAKIKDIPKEYHGLIPEGNLVAKLDWISKAEESGLFKKQSAPDVEIGKPLALGKKNEKANSNSTAQQKLSNYFSNFYSK